MKALFRLPEFAGEVSDFVKEIDNTVIDVELKHKRTPQQNIYKWKNPLGNWEDIYENELHFIDGEYEKILSNL